MEVSVSLFQLAFYAALFFTILGGVLGLIGAWVSEFWKNDLGWRLIITDIILAVTSIAVAVITKFLT